jgi:AGCS family alanine or glycine:cation symporter
MDWLNSMISSVNAFAWGPPMLGMLGVTGVLLTLGMVFMPWRKVRYGFQLLYDKDGEVGEGEVKPFNALMTALSATVGTGNIAGVATAIALGGPGAIFYMWLIALFGMATKYAEAVCAVTYREVDRNGHHVGGPMYYLRNGVGEFAPELGKWLGLGFAVFGAVAAFGIGNAVQVNSMATALVDSFGVPTWLTGVVVAALVAVVVIGGIQRIGEVAGKLVPAMIVLYIGAALLIILINITAVPAAIALIFTHAFTPAAAAGGFAGAAVAAAVRFGVARGVFSNESGLGSAAIAHAAAQTNSPVRQGVIAMLGTFIDTNGTRLLHTHPGY